jgi:hypothetical protein
MKHSCNIIIDDELWRDVKVEAAKQGKTLREFVSEILSRETTNLQPIILGDPSTYHFPGSDGQILPPKGYHFSQTPGSSTELSFFRTVS